jgi:hypothetical protein
LFDIAVNRSIFEKPWIESIETAAASTNGSYDLTEAEYQRYIYLLATLPITREDSERLTALAAEQRLKITASIEDNASSSSISSEGISISATNPNINTDDSISETQNSNDGSVDTSEVIENVQDAISAEDTIAKESEPPMVPEPYPDLAASLALARLQFFGSPALSWFPNASLSNTNHLLEGYDGPFLSVTERTTPTTTTGGVDDDLFIQYEEIHGPLDENYSLPDNCPVAASYYMLTAKKSFELFDRTGTSSSLVDDVRLWANEKSLDNFKGEDSDVVQYQIQAADGGDHNAQMWVGQQLYWGRNGLQRDVPRAMEVSKLTLTTT